MSVRATNRIIGEAVIVSVLPKSPHMVVKAVNEEAKQITTSWFSDTNAYQEGTFPASALDRVEPKAPPKTSKPKARR
jgi:hypothetical protein